MARGFIFFVLALFALVLSVVAQGELREEKKKLGNARASSNVRGADELFDASPKQFTSLSRHETSKAPAKVLKNRW